MAFRGSRRGSWATALSTAVKAVMLLLLLGAAATAADTATGGHHGKPLGGIARNSTVLGEPPSQVADLDLCGGEERLFQAAKKTTELGAGSEENGPHTSPYLSFYGRLYGGNMCNVKT